MRKCGSIGVTGMVKLVEMFFVTVGKIDISWAGMVVDATINGHIKAMAIAPRGADRSLILRVTT